MHKTVASTLLNVQPSSFICSNPCNSSMQLPSIGDNFVYENTKSILDENKLKLFLEEVRCQREPMKIVKKICGS